MSLSYREKSLSYREKSLSYREKSLSYREKSFSYRESLVVCDDNMIFRDVLVGWPGSVHDSRILRNSELYRTAATKFPGDTPLLGDGGYPLMRFVEKKK
ncbi:hypothetical protein QZH41_020370 [Actinostola sp. cb2023]|nr:hypothetical protein QZH41_020370 [Actinostola sp. cb2023]